MCPTPVRGGHQPGQGQSNSAADHQSGALLPAPVRDITAEQEKLVLPHPAVTMFQPSATAIDLDNSVQGHNEPPITQANSPQLFAAVESARAQGLEVKIVGVETRDGQESVVFRTFRQYTAEDGSTAEIATPYSVAVPHTRNYLAARDTAISNSLSFAMAHPPIVLHSRVEGYPPEVLSYGGAGFDEGTQAQERSGTHACLTKVSTVNGEKVFEYQLFSDRDSTQPIGEPVLHFGSRPTSPRNSLLLEAFRQADNQPEVQSVHIKSKISGVPDERLSETCDWRTRVAIQDLNDAGYDLCLTKISDQSVEYRLWDRADSAYVGRPLTVDRSKFADPSIRDSVISTGSSAIFERVARWKSLNIDPDLVIEHHPNTSQEFKDAVEDGLYAVASKRPNLVRELFDRGVTIHAQDHMLQRPESFMVVPPRGYNADDTWDAVAGLFDSTTREITICQRSRSGQDGAWTERSAEQIKHAIAHELGHAFDENCGEATALGIVPGSILQNLTNLQEWSELRSRQAALRDGLYSSSSSQFPPQYQADFGNMPAEWQQKRNGRLSYYLMDSGAGQQEAFAEAFAVSILGKEQRHYDDFNKHFPNVLRGVDELIAFSDQQ